MASGPAHLLNAQGLKRVIWIEGFLSPRSEEQKVKERLFAVIVLVSLICACAGNGQTTSTPGASPVARATATPEAATPYVSTSAPAVTDVLPSPTATASAEPTPTTILVPTPGTRPAGGLIAFTSERDGNGEIYVMNADGRDQRRLTDDPAYDAWPTWSPDGTRIAFVSTRSGNADIFVMELNGAEQGSGNLQQLTDDQEEDIWPEWSPDGTRIAFPSRRDGNFEIYVMDADGTNLQRLTNSPGSDDFPAWSPDSARIVFSRTGTDRGTYIINADGSNEQKVLDFAVLEPAWSPDGTQIAFGSDHEGYRAIYVMDVEGTEQGSGNLQRLSDTKAGENCPSWSPDGRQIVFASWRDGDGEIYVMDLDGAEQGSGSVQKLTDNRFADEFPTWQPASVAGDRSSTWIRTFEGPNYGTFSDIVLTGDGRILAVGATNYLHFPPYSGDALLMKLTLEGDVLWERTWGGDGYEHAWSVAPAGDGGYYVFGETDSYGAGGRDLFLLKISEDGTESWFRTYGGSGREWPFGMLPLSNEDLLIYGDTESVEHATENQYAIRVGTEGDVIWEYTVESPNDEMVIDVVETTEEDLVLAVVTGQDAELVRMDAAGNVQWTKRYELPGWQFASQIAQVDDDGFFLAGFAMSSGSRQQADTWLARCTATGELEWETSFGNSSFDDYAQSLIELDDGTYLIGGIGNGMLLSHVDQDGNVLWQRSLVGEVVYGAEALIELPDGGYLIAGLIQITNGRSYDAILLRTDAEGWVAE